MVDKNLNASIQLRYDTLNNWIANSSQILRKGEVACVEIPALDTTSGITNPPTVIFKVGDGTTPFAKLAWSSALAADVHTWAKQAALPVKCIDDITVDGYVEGNVISSITFANNEIQYTTTQVPTKKQMDIIEAALGSYISIKDRAVFENVPFSNKAISSDIFTILNSSIVAIQEGHKYRFEIINKENPDDLTITSFEAVAKQNEQITGLIIDFADSTEGYLYITDFTTANGRVNYLYHSGIYKLDISESTALSEGHIYLNLMPDNIKQSDSSTQYNYIKNNYIFNMYECGQLVLDIEAGAQVNKIDSVSSNFVISTDKQLELAQSVKDSLAKADTAIQSVENASAGHYAVFNEDGGIVDGGEFYFTPHIITTQEAKEPGANNTTAGLGFYIQDRYQSDESSKGKIFAEFHIDVPDQGGLAVIQPEYETSGDNDASVVAAGNIVIKEKGVTTDKIADNAVGAAQLKAEQNYTGDNAEIWIFDCGNSKF